MFQPLSVTPLPGFRIHLLFSDGVEGDVDLSHLAGRGVFSLWNDQNVFQSVSIGPAGEIRWSDEVELCPDSLYLDLTGKSPEEVFPKLARAAVNA